MLYFEKLVSEEQNHELISSAALAAGIAIERDQAERRLISVNAKLEQRVVERTHALTQSLREVERAGPGRIDQAVDDHVGDVDAVLDGNLTEFMEAALRDQMGTEEST